MKRLSMLMVIFLLLGLCSCQKQPEQPKEYTSENGAYSICVPGDLTQTKGQNEDNINLTNQKDSFRVMVQRMTKEQLAALVTTLEEFVNFNISTIQEAGLTLPQPSDFAMENGMSAKSVEYEVERDNQTSKAYSVYIESPNAFYIYSITGGRDEYDKNIESQKAAISSLKENQE